MTQGDLHGKQHHAELSGEVEIDGAYFGGYVKPRNYKENRRNHRLAENQTEKRKVVVAMRERGSNVATQVFKAEGEAVARRSKARDGAVRI